MAEAIDKAYRRSLEDFLIKESPQLKIPDFQRNFVWPRKNIAKFLTSIIDNDINYYMGNLFIQNGVGAGRKDLVIDGQQRLVTLSFILRAVLDLTNKDKDKKAILDLLFVPPSKNIPRLTFSRNGMDKIYKKVLKSKVGDIAEPDDKILRSVIKTYFFIRKLVKGKYDEEILKKIKKLRLVIIRSSTTHNAFSLYEGLNSPTTNKPLKPLELIKGLIVGERVGNNKFWQRMEEKFSIKSSIWFDKFVRSHLFTIYGRISQDDLYEKAKKEFKNNNKEYKNELEYYSSIYLSLRDAEVKEKFDPWKNMRSKDEINYILKGIRALKLDQVYAPLVALIKYGKLSKKEYYFKNTSFYDDLFKIWCFLLLFKFSDINPNKVETVFANFCKNICENPCNKTKFNKIRESFYRKLEKTIPSKPIFIKKLLEIIKYSAKSEGKNIGKKDITESILAFYLLNDEKRIMPETCDIEHIFPEGNDWSDWKINLKAKRKLVDNGLRYSLGNLTLLTPRDKGKNKNFRYKYKKIYSIDKKFKKNKELSIYTAEFNSKDPSSAVDKRGKDIGKYLYENLKSKLK